MNQCIIVDLDGTIAQDAHRQHFLNESPKNWARYFAGQKDDPPNLVVRDIMKTYSARIDCDIFIVTARPLVFKHETFAWLNKYGFPCDRLIMRGHGDYRENDLVKRDLYKKHIMGRYDVLFAIDDQTRVVRMWRRFGITCFQIDDRDY